MTTIGIALQVTLLTLVLGYAMAFALATMDPADAVRYAIPSLPLIALLLYLAVRPPQPTPAQARPAVGPRVSAR